VARDERDYLNQALAWAGDPEALHIFRHSIRDRILGCPAGDPKGYTLAVEGAYRTMWQRWVNQNPSTPPGQHPDHAPR